MVVSDQLVVFLIGGQLCQEYCAILPYDFCSFFDHLYEVKYDIFEFWISIWESTKECDHAAADVCEDCPVFFAGFDTLLEEELYFFHIIIESASGKFVIVKADFAELWHLAKWVQRANGILLKATGEFLAHI